VSFPRFYTEVSELIADRAMHKRMANAIVRKANLRRVPGEGGLRTVIDGYVHPEEDRLARQYATDLSGTTEVRLESQSVGVLTVLWASESAALETTFTPLAGGISATAGAGSGWVALGEGEDTAIRLIFEPSASPTPFAVLLQAR